MAKRTIIYYEFDLDLNPSDRWATIFDLFELKIPKLRKHIAKLFKQFESILPIVKEIFNLINPLQIMFYDEIKYIANKMKLSIHEVILLQLIYETSAACTTAIFEIGSDSAYFLRTMDWPMSFLKDITIGLDIKQNNKSIGKVIGWLGCVGFFTVQTDTYATAINYRRTSEVSVANIIANAYRTLSMNWPISYLVRYITEKQLSRLDAIKLYETAKLISPTYITICVYDMGKICKSESVIITRNWDTLVSTRSDKLIQTNCDCDKDEPDILWSLERRELFDIIIAELNEMETCSKKTVMKNILVPPILNQEMIYVYFSSGNKSIAFI